jgi:hypothetical protein
MHAGCGGGGQDLSYFKEQSHFQALNICSHGHYELITNDFQLLIKN